MHDAPPGIDQPGFSPEEAANRYESRIRQFIADNPADFYQLTNEIPASSSVDSIVNTLAFELEMAGRLYADGIRLAVGSPAFDSPQFSEWSVYFPPFLAAAHKYGAIYSRHTYGGVGTSYPWLTQPNGLTRAQERILQEVETLSQLGIDIPMILTECGTHAGIDRPDSWDSWINDMAAYDRWLQSVSSEHGYPIWGFAAFTYGNYLNANIQEASGRIELYMAMNKPGPKPPIGDNMNCRGKPRVDYRRVYYVIPEFASDAQAAEIFRLGWKDNRRTVGGSYDDGGVGDLSDKIAVLFGIPSSSHQTYLDWYAEHYPGTTVEFRPMPPGGGVNPMEGLKIGYPVHRPRKINRGFGVETDYGYPHEGVDMTGQGDQNVIAGVAGVVDSIGYSAKGYGNYVKISFDHNGFTFYRWLAHLKTVSVVAGEIVSPRTVVGVQGSTGHSTGIHVHDTLQAPPGYGMAGFVIKDVIDPMPYYYDVVGSVVENPGAVVGLHGPADPGISNAVVSEFVALKPKVAKVLSSVDKNDFGKLVSAATTVDKWIIRAFLDFGGRSVTPRQFFDWTFGDVVDCISRIPSGKTIFVELHNEPNLVAEGLGSSWLDGASFGTWLEEVRKLYRGALPPGVRIMFPGLSPIDYSGAHGQSWQSFWNDCWNYAKFYDAIGVHAYWSESFSMELAVGQVTRHLNFIPNATLYVTEASRNDRPQVVPNSQYAESYYEFSRMISPHVSGVTFFVASASNPFFHPEAWVVNGVSKGIGAGLRELLDEGR